VLGLGIILGTVFANTLGQRLVSILWAFMGASQIRFVIRPWLAYLLLPSLLVLAVSVAALSSTKQIKETNIAQVIME
jgi:putative ABC transport system permease protein